MQKDLPFWLAFNFFSGIGPQRFKLLLKYFGKAQKAYEANEETLLKTGLGANLVSQFLIFRQKFNPQGFYEEVKKKGITILTLKDKNYPDSLRQISDCPPVLYIKGQIKIEDELAVAIVGTRKISAYGREVTEILTRDLVASGLTIVSGLARGVDSLAHKIALEAAGRTIAVLGCGVDLVYPPENKALYEQIILHGAVVSEVAPGQYVAKGIFPARNRIIAGLSLGVVVTEGAEDSGALITARDAANQGREVFAVPGPITSYLSAASSILIKEGAKLVYHVSDILEELDIKSKIKSQKAKKIIPENPEEEKILQILENERLHIDSLVRISGMEAGRIASLLTLMEIKGKVKNLGGMVYTINK
ncbi:MAG: DNA-processing protein DprA [Patescibacteria group bacterium]|nr:DNA-processing protein DprA [Patescibacteria group bacterium]MCL5095649.1 DNA-processing protein DprA [Patescibacteria group bacterium]